MLLGSSIGVGWREGNSTRELHGAGTLFFVNVVFLANILLDIF